MQNRICLELREEEGKGWGRGQRGEVTQTMYAHVNKRIIKKDGLIQFSSNFF
jgi:hypothetical protein